MGLASPRDTARNYPLFCVRMNISDINTALENAPIDLPRTSHNSVRARSRALLKRYLAVAERRADLEGIGELSQGEERLVRSVIRVYESALREAELERPQLPPIALSNLTPEALRAMLAEGN